MEPEDITAPVKKMDFKKPILIGKIGKLPRKILPVKESATVIKAVPVLIEEKSEIEANKEEELKPAQELTDKLIPLPYKEPAWSGLPESQGMEYGFEILKSGLIIGSTKLTDKSFWVFGRLANCDICMAHPTISRYHAILQYRSEGTETESCGFYIYDLNSTHGTFINKNRIKPRIYVRIQVGHMIKLGCSTRTFILTGPEEDREEASELSITELKRQRSEDLLKKELAEKEATLKEEQEKEAKRKKDEERGVDWGMGDDADEETDIAENPFAQSNNEELYLDDPKKALRGFMEREGLDLEYDCSEQGMGQFLCKVVLPIDDERGKPFIAEVIHKGKKKEAVIQCALEACRILDRHGLLRQATHESRKRKAKNWEENDFYDSDDDTYLDRTGTIEKKRENRMKAKVPQQPETYQSLLEKEKSISQQIKDLARQLETSRKSSNKKLNDEDDSLDSYMKQLKQPKLDKQKITQLKTDLNKLKLEHANVIKLANVARPADLPALVPQYSTEASTSSGNIKNKMPIFGKRLKIKVQIPQRQNDNNWNKSDSDEDMKSDNEINDTNTDEIEINDTTTDGILEEIRKDENQVNIIETDIEENIEIVNNENNMDEQNDPKYPGHEDENQLQKSYLSENKILIHKFSKIVPHIPTKYKENAVNIWNSLKQVTTNQDSIQINLKRRKLLTHIKELKNNLDQKLKTKICKELKQVFDEIEKMGANQLNINIEVNETAAKLLEILEKLFESEVVINKLDKEDDSKVGLSNELEITAEEQERKRKKNQRRIQQRQERTEVERLRGYEEDAQRDDYNMWVPPQNQTGDGRTTLNDKLGY